MGKIHRSRAGSLQYWPRKRAERMLPRINWKAVEKQTEKNSKIAKGLLGFIGYKVGMISVSAKDITEHSMSKNKKIIVPATILECPFLKIYSARFYKNGKVVKDVILSNEKILKRKIKTKKDDKKSEDLDKIDFDDLKVIVYTDSSSSNLKKTPDMAEIAINGSKQEKLNFIKEKTGKTISVLEFFNQGLVDVRGVTKGKGLQGAVKRFGITLKFHKSEKGVRRPGSLAPWHPPRVTFRTPMAGQTGFQNRVSYNNLILTAGKISEKDINPSSGFHNYGKIKTEYLIVRGSIPGAKKRQLIITPSLRPTKYKSKLKYEVFNLI